MLETQDLRYQVGSAWLILYSKWDDSNSNSTSEPVKHSNNVLKKTHFDANDTLCAADTRIITKEKNNK